MKTKLSECNPNLFDGLSGFISRLSPLIDNTSVEALVHRMERASSSRDQARDEDAKSCMSLLLVGFKY